MRRDLQQGYREGGLRLRFIFFRLRGAGAEREGMAGVDEGGGEGGEDEEEDAGGEVHVCRWRRRECSG